MGDAVQSDQDLCRHMEMCEGRRGQPGGTRGGKHRFRDDGVKRFRLPAGYRPGDVLEGPAYRVLQDGICEVELKRSRIFVLEVKQ